MQFLLVRAANSSVVGKPEVIWAFQHFVARSRNGLRGNQRMISAKSTSGPEQLPVCRRSDAMRGGGFRGNHMTL